jgi:mannose/fructose/N-acetylgalactosamine-specific phosphotransferase system component IIB
MTLSKEQIEQAHSSSKFKLRILKATRKHCTDHNEIDVVESRISVLETILTALDIAEAQNEISQSEIKNVSDINHKKGLCAEYDTLKRDIKAVTILCDRGHMCEWEAIEKIKALLRTEFTESQSCGEYHRNHERVQTEKNTPENLKNDPNGINELQDLIKDTTCKATLKYLKLAEQQIGEQQ